MATIYLGISGAEYELPSTRWGAGDQPENAVQITMNVDKAQMLDGSVRYNFRNTHQRRWSLDFPDVTSEELWEFTYLCSLNDALRYQNNNHSTTWYDVVITEFAYGAINIASASAGCHYWVQLVLEEVL